MQRRFPRIRRWLALVVGAAGAVFLLNTSCTLDRSGIVVFANYDCTATLRSSTGVMEVVSTAAAPFTDRQLVEGSRCGLGPATGVEAYWRRWLRQVVATDPGFTSRGSWCVEAASCTRGGPASSTAACPAAITGPEIGACTPATGMCLRFDPAGAPLEPGFEGRLDFGEVPVLGSTANRITVSNTCAAPLRLIVSETFRGRDIGDFAFVSNGCGPRDADEVARGRVMGSAGFAGSSCDVDLLFRPTAAGTRGAQLVMSQDMAFDYQVALRGTGLAGTLSAPASVCFPPPLTVNTVCPAAGADTVVALLRLDNTGTVPVTLTEASAAATSGSFRVISPLAPFSVPALGSVTLQLVWCLGASDVDDDGTLTIRSNATNPDLFVDLDRRRTSCP